MFSQAVIRNYRLISHHVDVMMGKGVAAPVMEPGGGYGGCGGELLHTQFILGMFLTCTENIPIF